MIRNEIPFVTRSSTIEHERRRLCRTRRDAGQRRKRIAPAPVRLWRTG